MEDLTVAGIARQLRAAGCVFAEAEAQLLIAAAATSARLGAMVDRRVAGEPLEHVVGWAEFCGQRVIVAAGVFVPRRRSEFLVSQAAAGGRPGDVVADLCCGSGALGIAVAAALGGADLHAADIDPAAVACAWHNVLPAGGQVYQGDLFAALPGTVRGHIDILLANVPYVPTREIALLPAEARDHESRVALDGGVDGLGVLRRVARDARRWLAPGGRFLTETSERQAARAAGIVADGGLLARVAADTELGATVIIGTRPIG
ncbi:MAG: putative protein N(5)-glutamine methyltransferase [Streptosporangiaceae bacterium]